MIMILIKYFNTYVYKTEQVNSYYTLSVIVHSVLIVKQTCITCKSMIS